MSYKFDSLWKILNMMNSGHRVTAQSLMDELELKHRSIYRYMATLQVAGFPVIYDRKRQSYAFEDGFSLAKAGLSGKELLALALSKKLLKNFGSAMEEGLCQIEAKLLMKVHNGPDNILSQEEPLQRVGRHIYFLHEAMVNFQRTEIVYQALSTEETTTRNVDPYYIFYDEGFWNLRGYCHLRKELRTFALDRIIVLKTLHEHFVPRKISPHEELYSAFGSIIDDDPVEVVVRFDRNVKPYVQRKKWHKSQHEHELDDGRLEVSLTVNGIDAIKQWIYRWIPNVEVIAPDELRNIVKEELHAAGKKYDA